MTRVITVGREFGSGGAEIAGHLAGQIGWKLVDNDFIDRVAQLARVSRQEAQRCDERVDSWFHRTVKALWHGGYEGVATSTEDTAVVFDSDTMARLSRHVIEEAATLEECVIVGRGAQCILQDRAKAFHVFVYAPWPERVERVRRRLGANADPETVILETDRYRDSYIRRHFNQAWTDRHLYDLMINSTVGVEAAARAIACAARVDIKVRHA